MKNVLTSFCFLFLFLNIINLPAQGIQCGEKIAVANTETGKVRGYIRNATYTYKGIPYAQAERFMPPAKLEYWDGIRSAMTYGPVAPLENPTTSVNDEMEFIFDHDWGYPNEDCMRLNIWTPSIDDGKKRPVMFWIHGGGFTTGSSQELPATEGESLSKKGDVVVVSINHRLNILGFLDLSAYGEKYAHSANLSILDIAAALEWVKANISNFGGDPDNVTIFGQSGGGAKVNTLMAMPKAKGLFHKAINQSGSFRSTMLEKEETQSVAAEVLSQLGLDKSQADSLQHIPFSTLSAAGRKALKIVADKMKAEGKTLPGFGLNWGPSRDGTDLPYQLYTEEALALSRDIPLLIGTVKNEFMPSLRANLSNASMDQIKGFLKQNYGDKAEAYLAAVKKAYPDDTKPSDLIDVDIMFRPGAVEQANIKSGVPRGAPVYMYLFTWQSPIFDGKYKAIHCCELPFVFNNIERGRQMVGESKEAYALADKVSLAWINFARSGDPNHAGLPKWPMYDSTSTATMHFDNSCAVKPQLDKDLFDLVRN